MVTTLRSAGMLLLGMVIFVNSAAFGQQCSPGPDSAAAFLPVYVVREVTYAATVENATAFINTTLNIDVLRSQEVTVPVFSRDIAVARTKLPKGVLLIQKEANYFLYFPGKGSYSVDIAITRRIVRENDRNMLHLDAMPAAVSTLELTLQGSDLDIRISPEVSATTEQKGKTSKFTAYLGTTRSVDVNWYAQSTARAGEKTVFFTENNTLILIRPEVVRTQSNIRFSLAQGRRSKFVLQVPAKMNVLGVKGAAVKNWKLQEGKDVDVLEIEMTKDIADTCDVIVDAEEVREDKEDVYNSELIATRDAERETGCVAFAVQGDIKIQPVQTKGLTQVDVKDAPEQLRQGAGGAPSLSLAYRFLRQPGALSVKIEKIKPEIQARSNIFVHLSEETLKSAVDVEYTIEKAGIFNFMLRVPADMELADISGENIENWKLSEANPEGKTLDVQLRSKAIGIYHLRLDLEKPFDGQAPDISVPVITVLGTEKITGYIGVSCESSIRLKTREKRNLTEVALQELKAMPSAWPAQPVLAYKFLSQPYSLQLGAEKVDPRVMADVFTFMSVGEGLMLLNSSLTFNILFAGVDEFSFSLPADVTGVDITGEGIKAKDEKTEEKNINGKIVKRNVYTITLHSKARGAYTLYCAYEKVLNNFSEVAALPALEVLKVERQTGSIAIGPRSSVEIELKRVEGANQVDVKELPAEKLSGIDVPVVQALKYSRYPYAVDIDVKKHEDVSVLVAVVESATITSVLGSDGQLIVSAAYQIKNRSKQYLDLLLPKNSAIWSTFVDGKAVKPAQTEAGKILLPLPKYEEKDRSFPVEIIYETKQSALGFLGGVGFAAPQFDIPLTNVTWNVYLPFGYRYTARPGNMEKGRLAFARMSGEESKLDKEQVMPSAVGGRYRQVQQMVADLEDNQSMPQVAGAMAPQESDRRDEPRKSMAKSKDERFLSNFYDQVSRYQKSMKAEPEKEISQGRQRGVLPIHITIPTGGQLFTFSKLFSREPLQISFAYSKARGKIFFVVLILIAGVAYMQRKTIFRWLFNQPRA